MISLFCHILSQEDYINLVAQLDNISDAKNLLNFLLWLLWFDDMSFLSNHSDSSTVDMNWRGRQFMCEVFSKMQTMPSLNGMSIMSYDPDSHAFLLLLYILKDSFAKVKVRHFP
jgi:hypothetical protein